MVQVMGYHPQYLDAFQKTQQFLLRGDGPLPHEYRHYIAIMVSKIFVFKVYADHLKLFVLYASVDEPWYPHCFLTDNNNTSCLFTRKKN